MKRAELKQALKNENQNVQIVWVSARLLNNEYNRGDYHCIYFSISELVSKKVLRALGETGSWALFDVDILMTLDWLRLTYGPATINTVKHQSRGFRSPSSPYFSNGSMHSTGNAFDIIFKDCPTELVRESLIHQVKQNRMIPAPIRRLEDKVSWFHFDSKKEEQEGYGKTYKSDHNTLYVFNP